MEYGIVGAIRGGTIVADFTVDLRRMQAIAGAVKARASIRADIDRVIDETGVWLRPFANFVYAMPPLVTDSATVRRIADAIARVAALPPGPECQGDFHE